MKYKFLELLAAGEVLISDGAVGTGLQQIGLPIGAAPESWVLENPGSILELHNQFIQAGAEIILTCTFGGTRARLAEFHLEAKFAAVNRQAVEIARTAAEGRDVLVAGSIGPLGFRLAPDGTMSVDAARTEFSKQAELLCDEGVDLIVIETQYCVNEARAAVNGVRSVDEDIPIVCSFSFDRDACTWTGEGLEDIVAVIGSMAVDVLGINCGLSLTQNLEALKRLGQLTDKPIWFKPNAGIPVMNEDGVPIYPIAPVEMGAAVPRWIEAGAQIVGGCCGTSPVHLREISKQVRRWRLQSQ